MKILIYINSYLLYISGMVISICGILIIFGLTRIFSGGAPNNLFSGIIGLYSIISGGTVFVGGLLVIAVSQILILLMSIASKE